MIADEMVGEPISLPHLTFQQTNALAPAPPFMLQLSYSPRIPCQRHLLFLALIIFLFPLKHCLILKNIERCSNIYHLKSKQKQHAPNSSISQPHSATALGILPVTSVTPPSSSDLASWERNTGHVSLNQFFLLADLNHVASCLWPFLLCLVCCLLHCSSPVHPLHVDCPGGPGTLLFSIYPPSQVISMNHRLAFKIIYTPMALNFNVQP